MSSNIINFLDIKRTRTADADALVKPPLTTQMAFPFEGASMLFFTYVADFEFPDDFLNFCSAEMPDVLMDMRVAPRLDFVRPVRSQAFELFELFGIEYRDVLGRLGAISYDMTQRSFEQVISTIESLHTTHDEKKPILVLFDNATFAQSCATKLARAFQVVMLDAECIRRSAIEGARLRM
jgi:hypothetical protein